MLGQKVSKKGVAVDKAKVDMIYHLRMPSSVKQVKSFLDHTSFYRDLLRILVKWLPHLLISLLKMLLL